MPHHLTQQGNRRQQTFFYDGQFQRRLKKKPTRVLRCQKSGPNKPSQA
jgi:hypothetical protein